MDFFPVSLIKSRGISINSLSIVEHTLKNRTLDSSKMGVASVLIFPSAHLKFPHIRTVRARTHVQLVRYRKIRHANLLHPMEIVKRREQLLKLQSYHLKKPCPVIGGQPVRLPATSSSHYPRYVLIITGRIYGRKTRPSITGPRTGPFGFRRRGCIKNNRLT